MFPWHDYCFTYIKPNPIAMKKSLLIFVIFILILSCEKADKVCNCSNSPEDIPWLNELKASFSNCTCQISIIQATYRKQTVFYPIMNDPLCNSYQQINLVDCSGKSIKTYTTTDQAFGSDVTNRKIIYTCKTAN
jgi:hypothetical protein